MYEIAMTVSACLRAGTDVDVAWVVDAEGFDDRDPAEALALTPGGGRVGAALGGALDGQLATLATRGGPGRLLDVDVPDIDALVAGLPHGGQARCLVIPASRLPADLWGRLETREALCLVTRLDDVGTVVDTALFTDETLASAPDAARELAESGRSATAVLGDTVITVLHPVATFVVAGPGPVAAAVASAAAPLGWTVRATADLATATGWCARLAAIDKVLVAGHDVQFAGPVLAAALGTPAGYVGAVGSRSMREQRAAWLADRGITGVERVRTPAGLDIGATTPAEIAIAVLAEVIATGSAPPYSGTEADQRSDQHSGGRP